MKRQRLITTIKELRELIEELEDEFNVDCRYKNIGFNKKFQINIINKSELSDGWEFE